MREKSGTGCAAARRRAWPVLGLALALLFSACSGKGLLSVGSEAPSSSSLPAESASVADSSAAAQPATVPGALPQTAAYSALTGLGVPEGMQEEQRPVAVAVMNHPRALPQRGLAAADVLVEMPVNGQETRYLALYADYRSLPVTGPVASTQDQLVQFALPLDAVQAHIGKSDYARNLLEVSGAKDVDGLHLGKTAFWFDEARNLPHVGGGHLNEYCWFTDAEHLQNGMAVGEVPGVGEVPSLFHFGLLAAHASGEAHYVRASYSDMTWAEFYYNAVTRRYQKYTYGYPHTDEDGSQLTYTNVLLLSVGIQNKADSDLYEFDFRQGPGLYFTAGGMQKVYWSKGGPTEALRLTNEAGSDILVQPGKSYIGFLPYARENAAEWKTEEEVALQRTEEEAAASRALEEEAERQRQEEEERQRQEEEQQQQESSSQEEPPPA